MRSGIEWAIKVFVGPESQPELAKFEIGNAWAHWEKSRPTIGQHHGFRHNIDKTVLQAMHELSLVELMEQFPARVQLSERYPEAEIREWIEKIGSQKLFADLKVEWWRTIEEQRARVIACLQGNATGTSVAPHVPALKANPFGRRSEGIYYLLNVYEQVDACTGYSLASEELIANPTFRSEWENAVGALRSNG